MRRFGRLFSNIIAPLLLAGWVAYLGYGAFAGASGYHMLAELEAEAAALEAEVAALRDRRADLEKRASLLHPKSLDPDMIDERIRAVLGYALPGDIVVPKSEVDRMVEEARAKARSE